LRLPVGCWLVSSLLVAAAVAHAQQTQTISLNDGTSVTGDVVEYVAGDHVTLSLPSGEKRRIAWGDLALPAHPPTVGGPATAVQPLPPPPAAPTGMVVLKDGTVVRGPVLESIQGDHVTVQNSDGTSRRFPWDQVAFVMSGTAPSGVAVGPSTSITTTTWQTSGPVVGELARLGGLAGVQLGALAGNDTATTVDWPEPDRSPPTVMPARLSLGVQGGVDSVLGYMSLDAEYFPFSWLGLQAQLGLPIADEPVTLAESLLVEWRLGAGLTQGLGVGLAHTFAKTVIPGQDPGVIQYITADCSHLTYYFVPQLGVRATIGFALALGNTDYCTAHPEACPQLADIPITGSLTLLWNLDLSHGQN
jgi:hypothetical protein